MSILNRGDKATPCGICGGPKHTVTYLHGQGLTSSQRSVAICRPCDGYTPKPPRPTNVFGQPTDGRGTE